jgi:hypothetical protein
MIAPFPYNDIIEFPNKLIATIFAYILEPHGKENGDYIKVFIGIEHYV